ncbi:unnamed protein product [Pleuronectes platessa]|uniref:Uncharacterized protein n=1 Tax=Pleuronectes platessa TaxID=8262 RepID=A0A9N7Y461_PLEPL|nr:unnamed protein product [Pleuronectes platessa]
MELTCVGLQTVAHAHTRARAKHVLTAQKSDLARANFAAPQGPFCAQYLAQGHFGTGIEGEWDCLLCLEEIPLYRLSHRRPTTPSVSQCETLMICDRPACLSVTSTSFYGKEGEREKLQRKREPGVSL